MMVRIRKAGRLGSSLCEWSPDNGKWYPVSRDNMQIDGSLPDQSNLFNALLAGLIASVKGSYSRKQKKLTLKL